MNENLSSLSTFVCVARHNSFTKAAKELHLTQGAISSQIKQLESDLGFLLFHRKVREIHLTQDGKELLEISEPAINQIQLRIERIKSRNLKESILTVSTINSFATKWLIPRIINFQEKQPGIDLRMYTSFNHVDFVNEKVDCAIRFGIGEYTGLSVTCLADDMYFPVCSPELIEKDNPLNRPDDIKNYQLLHDEITTDKLIGWKHWAEVMGVSHLNMDRGAFYEDAHFVIQAAIAKQGIAIARLSLVEDDLKSGVLIPLFNRAIKSEFSYYFVCPKEFENMDKVRIFRQWLLETLQEGQRDAERNFGLKLLSPK